MISDGGTGEDSPPDEEAGGCGCSSGSGASAALLFMVLGLLAVSGHRRSFGRK